MNAGSLLERIQGLLERTYRMTTGVSEVGRFVIGDAGYRELYAHRRSTRMIGAGTDSGATTLVREAGGGVRACIYFPDEMIRRLETEPPERFLGESNVDAFATFVEELDHLLCIAERSLANRPVSLFELELHANVSKHLVVSRYRAGAGRRLTASERAWVRYHLFDKADYVHQRYRDAARYGVRFIDALAGRPRAERIDALRCFHEAGARKKVRLIETLSS